MRGAQKAHGFLRADPGLFGGGESFVMKIKSL